MSSADKSYWADYDGLQFAKHRLLECYLGGWFPILASRQGRVIYIDCHAGRGRHKTGEEGSPILALRLLLNHPLRDRILAKTEVHFYFFEIDSTNYGLLADEIASLGPLPANMVIVAEHADYEEHLRAIFANLRSQHLQMAPSFAFLDPFGFSISIDFLNDFLSFPGTELLVNFMYRYVDMAIHQEALADRMNALFGCDAWRNLPQIVDSEQRSIATIQLFSDQLRARYATHMYMRATNGALKYALIHASNHPRGRELIKEAMWSVARDGSFTASERNSPHQLVLLVPEPDCGPLEDAIWKQFAGRSVAIGEMYDWLVGELYLKSHLHQVLRRYRANGIVTASGYQGRFAFNKSPVFSFPAEGKQTKS